MFIGGVAGTAFSIHNKTVTKNLKMMPKVIIFTSIGFGILADLAAARFEE